MAISFDVHAQSGVAAGYTQQLTIERYQEDWSSLANPSLRSGRWPEPFKYIALDEDGSVYVTTGIEVRWRYEGFQSVNWGASGDDGYLWHRVMPYVDLHAGGLQIFAQSIFSDIYGTDRPPSPVDTTGADILQAFVGYNTDVTDGTTLSFSGGRKLFSLGAGRFIDNRYGPNILQAFDGVDATLSNELGKITMLYFHPVDSLPGDFDDRPSRQKVLWGAYGTLDLNASGSTGIDLFYLGLRDRGAIVDQGAGREMVHTFGSRFFGDTGTVYWNVEAAVQTGTFADNTIAAWAVGGELRYRWTDIPLAPEAGLAINIISGDKNPNDQRLNTFDPLFPKGKFFGELSPIGPRNLIHMLQSIAVHPHDDVTISLSASAYWRESTDDGIYAMSGNLLRSGKESDARYIGKQLELAVSWQATPELNLSASASIFDAGRFIRETGPAETTRMVGVSANFRF